MFQATLKRIQTGDQNRILFEVPKSLQLILWAEVKKSPEYLNVKIGRPSKPRTTGELSQNHHVNGHIQQICQETGNDFDAVKLYCKTRALERGYPFDTINGVIIPWSETRLDTEQCAIFIEAIHQVAAEEGVELIENE
jgi:hypothetical protein